MVIAGNGPDLKVLQEQVERLTLEDYVIFTGDVVHEDVGNYYRMADLFVSASDTETQGLTYIEALAAGTRCVVYDTDYTEHVFDSDTFGKVFTTQKEMLIDILTYLKQGREEMPKEALQEKLSQLSAAYFATEVHDFYQDAIANYQEEQEEETND